MDCFLISDCIWDEETGIRATREFVKEAIRKYGYTVDLNFKDIRDEFDGFKNEIEGETRYTKKLQKEEPVRVNEGGTYYHEVDSPPNSYEVLIRQADWNTASQTNRSTRMYYRHYGSIHHQHSSNIRRGSSLCSIIIDDREYKLRSSTTTADGWFSKKPHEAVEKLWDDRTSGYLAHVDSVAQQIEDYRTKDLSHLRTNLFVNPDLAVVVESHISEALKTVEKFAIEFRELQNSYKNLKADSPTSAPGSSGQGK